MAEIDVAALPKVELHVHLEGTVTPETAIAMARRHGIDPAILPLVNGRYPERFTDFMHFVETYIAVSALIRTPEDLHAIAVDFSRQQARDRVLYTEATFTALTHVNNGMEPGPMWEAVRTGLVEGGAEVRLIVDAVRDAGVEHGRATVTLVEEADAPIVGLGLTGIEGSLDENEMAFLRTAADRRGLGLAVHAGETGPPLVIERALDDLGADRIGHGISCVRDPALMERLKLARVPIEVCPTSNVVIGVAPSLEEHPFPEMWAAGLNVTVNSDDPSFFSTTLSDELLAAVRLAGLSAIDVVELQRRAALAAFAPEHRRRELVAAIDAWLEPPPHSSP